MAIETRTLRVINMTDCPVAFLSSGISRQSTLTRNNCASGVGSTWTITIAQGAYTSQVSQADADAQANAAANALDTQANANANGNCISSYDFSPIKANHSEACASVTGFVAGSLDAVLIIGSVMYFNPQLTATLPAGYYKAMPNNISVRLNSIGAIIEIQNC